MNIPLMTAPARDHFLFKKEEEIIEINEEIVEELALSTTELAVGAILISNMDDEEQSKQENKGGEGTLLVVFAVALIIVGLIKFFGDRY